MSSLADTLETPYYAAIIESTPHEESAASENITTADRLVSFGPCAVRAFWVLRPHAVSMVAH